MVKFPGLRENMDWKIPKAPYTKLHKGRVYKKKFMCKHTSMRLQNIKYKEKILNIAREKGQVIYKKETI